MSEHSNRIITIRGEFLLCACLVFIAAVVLRPQARPQPKAMSVTEPAKRVVIVLEPDWKGVEHEQFK